MPAMLAGLGREVDCLAGAEAVALPIYAIRPEGLAALLETMPERAARFVEASGFAAKSGAVLLVPGGNGIAGALLGLGADLGPLPFGALAGALPAGSVWRFAGHLDSAADAVLGFCLGAYRFSALKSLARPAPVLLVPPAGTADAQTIAHKTWLVRDLINLPPNVLGPPALARVACALLEAAGASVHVTDGTQLLVDYPLVAAVGQGSAQPPCVLGATWQSRRAGPTAPLISLCGKGICFDTGGYDVKPPAGMLRMQKDMAGAAVALGVALCAIALDLPLRLELRLACAENSISGAAMRPSDVVRSRRGLSVFIGNTDAEGRLVLADILAEASDQHPDLLLDFATLTGAARVALGPEMVALFANDDALAEEIARASRLAYDPTWRLPLYDSYNYLLESHAADLNNVSDKPYAGAVIAALFLQRFVASGVRWAHFDLYGWNDSSRPGRPEGGEAQGLRAAMGLLSRFVNFSG
jgi:leucyl aminopeptidase